MMLPRSTAAFLLMAATVHAQTAPMPSMPAMPGQQTNPAPPAQALPEVSVPTVSVAVPESVPVAAPAALVPPSVVLPATVEQSNAPAASAVEAARENDVPAAIVGTSKDYSYGDSDLSLLFTPKQMQRMKAVLSGYEFSRRNRKDAPIEVVQEGSIPAIEMVPEPALYPVFTLKSIAFRNARDWTVWIGDLRISPHKNNQEVKVIAVAPNRAQFVWKPAYSEAMRQRAVMKMFAPINAVKHKATRTNTAIFDSAAGQATFTLLQNQSFAPAYMATFEGKIASPTLEKLPEEDKMPEDIAPAETGDTSASNPNNLDALLKQQQKGGAASVFQRTLSNPSTN